MSVLHRLELPPLAPSPFRRMPRDDLLAHIAGLELENLRLLRKAIDLASELRAARAHARHLGRRLAKLHE